VVEYHVQLLPAQRGGLHSTFHQQKMRLQAAAAVQLVLTHAALHETISGQCAATWVFHRARCMSHLLRNSDLQLLRFR
jgi:hypothetical protein